MFDIAERLSRNINAGARPRQEGDVARCRPSLTRMPDPRAECRSAAVLDGWDLTGTGTLRRSPERDFPRSDVKGAYQVLARFAPEVARRVHPNNYEATLNVLVRRMAGEASNEVATPFAFEVYGVDRGEAETDRGIETTLDTQIRDGLLEEIAELDRRYRLVGQGVGATWRRRRMGIASSSAWPRQPGRQSRSSKAPALLPPEPSARLHLGVLETAAVVVPQTWRVAG
jgi:hypothetical protein